MGPYCSYTVLLKNCMTSALGMLETFPQHLAIFHTFTHNPHPQPMLASLANNRFIPFARYNFFV